MDVNSRWLGRLPVIVAAATIALASVLGLLAWAGAAQASEAPLPAMPSPPPPLDPPLIAPAPGLDAEGAAQAESVDGLTVLPFQPKIQLRRGEQPPHPEASAAEKGGLAPQGLSARPERGPAADYLAPDFTPLQFSPGWNLLMYEGFEGVFPTTGWTVFDFSPAFPQFISWDDVPDASYSGSWTAWPMGTYTSTWTIGYTNSMYAWMEYGPVDLTEMSDAFLSFGLWYDTEASWDWIYFCLSADGVDYNCDYWSGYSGGWQDQARWLTSYAGYANVYVAWIFMSDSSIAGYLGPFVDEIYLWGYVPEAVTPPPPDPAGQLIRNGSFEQDLNFWTANASSLALGEAAGGVAPNDVSVSQIVVTTSTFIEGAKSVYLWNPAAGNDYLYQTFTMSAGVDSVVVNYWFALPTFETVVGRDLFCASLRPGGNPLGGAPLVDFGCIDATAAAGYWQEVNFTLSAAEVNAVVGQSVALVFEMYNAGPSGSGTAVYLDYVHVYAVGDQAAAPLDPNEPNNSQAQATALDCIAPITPVDGVIGDALGGADVDWFQMTGVPAGVLQLDIDARTLIYTDTAAVSTLDSVLRLYNQAGAPVAVNDDDGLTYDSFISYTVASPGQTYYASVESYSGVGSATHRYRLSATCNATGGAPAGGNAPSTSTITGTVPPADTWTVMLYLNAEDPGFADILTGYRTEIEKFIGSKSSFLKVVIQYDGPGNTGTTRYLVQPNGNYTNGVNRFVRDEANMGDPATLADFVGWAMDQYPAENYFLAIDDHGDGAYGVSWDPSSANDQLTPPEVYSALKQATRDGARKIDIVDFEACLMGLTENAYDLRAWADYVVFSEQISWGILTYPNYFSDLAGADDPLTVGRRVVQRYHATADAEDRPHTISLIDTSRLEAVNTALNNFANALIAANNKSAITAARDGAQAFANDADATNPLRADYIDLWDLADRAAGLAPAQAAALKTAVLSAVAEERHSSGGVDGYIWQHGRARGLSIYYPASRASSAFASYTAPSLYQMSQTGGWDEFLLWAVPSSSRRGMSSVRAEVRLTAGDTFIYRYVYLPTIRR